MKFKISATLLAVLFVVFIVLAFISFAIMLNSKVYITSGVILILELIAGSLLFVFGMRLLSEVNKLSALPENIVNEISSNETVHAEIPGEKSMERELDLKKIIPKEKLKLEAFCEELLKNFSNEIQAVQSLIYIKDSSSDFFRCVGKFAYYSDTAPVDFKIGETLPGQAVKNRTVVTISNVPDNYMIIASGLGKGDPCYLTFVPVVFQDEVIGLIEFASFSDVTEHMSKGLQLFSDKVADSISKFLKKL